MFSFLTPYRLYAYIALVLALIGGYLWWHHEVFIEGDANGYARGHVETVAVQTEYDGYRAKLAEITKQREIDNRVKDAQTKATNEAALHEMQIKLDSAQSNADNLARRLYAYAHQGSCSTALPPPDNNSVSGTSTEPSSEEVIERASAYDAACIADAARLDALIQQLKPQLSGQAF